MACGAPPGAERVGISPQLRLRVSTTTAERAEGWALAEEFVLQVVIWAARQRLILVRATKSAIMQGRSSQTSLSSSNANGTTDSASRFALWPSVNAREGY